MIKVINFKPQFKGIFLGLVEVEYYELRFYAEVIVGKNYDSIWIKLPQRRDSPEHPFFNLMTWVSKEISDLFQDEVIKQLNEHYANEIKIPSKEEIKKKLKEFRAKKNGLKKGKFTSGENAVEPKNYPIGKARSQSKFIGKKSGNL